MPPTAPSHEKVPNRRSSGGRGASAWFVSVPVAVALSLAVLAWLGWATGGWELARGFLGSAYMVPWTGVCLAALGAAILLQANGCSGARVWAGRTVALVSVALALIFLMEYATQSSFGLDKVWFSQSVGSAQPDWPGRPSPVTVWSLLPLSIAVSLLRVDTRSARAAWAPFLFGASITPFVTGTGYLFGAKSLVHTPGITGQAITTSVSLLLLVVAALSSRPDRNPIAWILARPDRTALVRLIAILAGLPPLVVLTRIVLSALGLRADSAWALGVVLGAAIIGIAVFVASQREQSLWIEKERLSSERARVEAERAETEKRYHILADNSVDVILHYSDGEITWISPSVEPAFGWPSEQWTGTDFLERLYPDDVGLVLAKMQEIAEGKSVRVRVRIVDADGGLHWVDAHTRLYFDRAGNPDGVIAALRVVDDQVEAERRLERLAQVDALTGLANRRETFSRLESALEGSRKPGTRLGVLFCDIDSFKSVNDTFGHGVGDAVLSTLAGRVCEAVRYGDTVGRTGGDEMLVLLPGLHNFDEATQIAKKILCHAAEPIHASGQTIRATLSIGATLVIPGEPVSQTTARADAAMYQAKHSGGNTVDVIQGPGET